MAIKTIAFDLDDTLVNTSELLVPEASKQSFQLLISNGLNLTLQECENFRRSLIKTISHKDLFIHLAEKYGTEKTKAVTEEAVQLFYAPSLPENLHLIEGAQSMLDTLKPKYTLYLVTAGYEKGQLSKVEKLGIKKYFKDVFVVNSLSGEKKFDAFKKILQNENHEPNQLLCVGNSLSSEIKDGKKIGAQTCYFEFGEDRGLTPHHDDYKPTFHIKNINDLIQACHL